MVVTGQYFLAAFKNTCQKAMLPFNNVLKKVVNPNILGKILLDSQRKAISEQFAVYFAVPQMAEKLIKFLYCKQRAAANFQLQAKMKYFKICRCVLGNSVSITTIFGAMVMKLSAPLDFCSHSFVVASIILLFCPALNALLVRLHSQNIIGDFRRQKAQSLMYLKALVQLYGKEDPALIFHGLIQLEHSCATEILQQNKYLCA